MPEDVAFVCASLCGSGGGVSAFGRLLDRIPRAVYVKIPQTLAMPKVMQ